MKKRSCRMTSEEKSIHEFAVKIRKMTDKQIYDFINSANTDTDVRTDDVYTFIDSLENQNGNGIGPVTVKKIKDYAIKEGFLIGD